jgi:hypothetical protein
LIFRAIAFFVQKYFLEVGGIRLVCNNKKKYLAPAVGIVKSIKNKVDKILSIILNILDDVSESGRHLLLLWSETGQIGNQGGF